MPVRLQRQPAVSRPSPVTRHPSSLGSTITKNKLSQLTHFQGKRMSDFIRETIEEKLSQMDRQNFEAQMKAAYQGLAEENIRISDDFKYADSENLS
jgi:hypothetical protein